MQPGNGEDVDRAGGQEVVGLVAGQRLPTAEQQSRGERRPNGRHVALEHGEPAGPQGLDPPGEDERPAGLDQPHTAGRCDADDRQAAVRTGPRPKIKLAWIERCGRPQPAAEHSHPIADPQRRRAAVHDHHGPTRRESPPAADTMRLDADDAFARRPDGGRTPRIPPRRHLAERLLDRPADGDRRGRLRQLPGEVVATKEIESRLSPGGAARCNRGTQGHEGHPWAVEPRRNDPREERCQRCRPTSDRQARPGPRLDEPDQAAPRGEAGRRHHGGPGRQRLVATVPGQPAGRHPEGRRSLQRFFQEVR